MDENGNNCQSDGNTAGTSSSESLLAGEEVFKQSCTKELALLALIERTGYNIMQDNGQRKYGGPPPGWEGPPPPRGCEIFVGKIPRDMYEDELVPLFERAGQIYEFRLMMQFSGDNRGYGFVMYTKREAAQRAILMFDNYEIHRGKYIGVCLSLDNCRLFIGSIPRDIKREEILEEMRKVTDGVVDVIAFPSYNDKSRKRHFAFVEYESHKAAAMARRKLIPGTFQLWGSNIQVDWAKPGRPVDTEGLQQVKSLYVRNISGRTTEETLYQEFSHFKPGAVDRVKMFSDHAFVHYSCHEDALTALNLMDGTLIDNSKVDVTLARPAKNKEMNMFRKRNDIRGHNQENNNFGEDLHSSIFSEVRGDTCGTLSPRPIPHSSDRRSCISICPADNANMVTVPLYAGTPLTPISPLALKQSQICSAVTLLDIYCYKNSWLPPEYLLFSSPGRNEKLLLLYKIVISSTQNTYMPDRLCLLLDDAKELAARTALLSIESSCVASCYPSRCPSPGNSPTATGSQGFPNYGGRTLTPACCPLLPPSLYPPPPPPVSPSYPMSTSTPQSQRVYMSPLLPFY